MDRPNTKPFSHLFIVAFWLLGSLFSHPVIGRGQDLHTTHINTKKEIKWWLFDIEPAHYISEENQDKGIYGAPQAYIMKRLHSYEHHQIVGNIARILYSLENKEETCVNGGFYGPEFPLGFKVAYSIPNTMLYPHGIVIRKDDRDRFTKRKDVSLASLLDNMELTFGYALGDKAGKVLNEVIEKRLHQKNIYLRGSKDKLLEGLLQMLIQKHIDYTTIYPHNFKYYSQKAAFKDKLAFIPLTENRDEHILISVNCPNTEWGHSIIREINTVLATHRTTPEYRLMILATGVAPVGEEQEYWRIFQEKVLTVHK